MARAIVAVSVVGALGVTVWLSGCRQSVHQTVLSDRVAAAAGPISRRAGVRIDFEATAGAQYLARVEQLDVDATLELLDADGKSLLRTASPARGMGREYLFWTASKSARLHLVIAAVAVPATSARYIAEIFRLPPQLGREKILALQHLSQVGSASPNVARDLRSAEDSWRSSGDLRLAADAALQLAGQLYFNDQNWSQALSAAQRAATAFIALHDSTSTAGAQLLEGAAQIELANIGELPGKNYPAAYQAFSQARAVYQQGHQPLGAASVLLYEGAGQYNQNEFTRAVASYQRADAEFAAVRAISERTLVLPNIAALRLSRGEYREAAATLELALPLMTDSMPELRATVLQNSATALQAIGQSELAIQRYLESLDIAKSMKDDSLAARALTGLGLAHMHLGQSALAVTYLTQAAALIRPLKDRDRLAIVLSSLGDAYARHGEARMATLTHREALATLSPTAAPTRRARLILALANELAEHGQTREAMDLYSGVIGSQESLQNIRTTEALIGRARANRSAGRLAEAQRDITRAVQLADANGDRENLIRATQELALLARRRGDPQQALREAQAAVAQLEQLQGSTASPDNRVTLTAQLREVYDLQVDLLAEASEHTAAHPDNDSARNMRLQALLAVDHAASRSDADRLVSSDASNADATVDAIYESLAGKRKRLEDLAERHAVATVPMQSLQLEIAMLQSRLASRMQNPVKSASPYDDTHRTAADLQHRVPQGSAVLVYRLGASQSWLWILTQDRFEMHRLPARIVIDRQVDELLRKITSLKPAASVDKTLAALRAALLPAELQHAAYRQWLVMPDGSTGALPWALLEQGAARSVTEIATLSSLTQPLRMRQTARKLAATIRIALLGDPIFGADDPRLGAIHKPTALPPMSALPRLPGTGAELDAIASLGADSIVLRRSGAEATRSAVLNLSADTVDVLHLATHATLDAEVPALAALVMSRFDASGHYQPGELRPRDILRMHRPPPVVVLSACDTAADPSRSAPGLMNLSRAFLGAGSHSVVASLWPVSDAGAVAFMTEFYRGLLRQHLTAAAALAFAQSALAKSQRFSEPFFWSGFVIIGEDL